MKIMPTIHFSSQNLIDHRQESYTRTSKRYLNDIINTIASYVPLITFWTIMLYSIPELEAHAIIAESPTTTTTPELDQIHIKPAPLVTKEPCPFPEMRSRTTNMRICYQEPPKNESSCTIL